MFGGWEASESLYGGRARLSFRLAECVYLVTECYLLTFCLQQFSHCKMFLDKRTIIQLPKPWVKILN